MGADGSGFFRCRFPPGASCRYLHCSCKMSGFANVVGNLSPLPELVLWRDPVARSGEEAMAVDEALLEWGEKPVLRAYRWAEPTVTYGYFDEEATARAIFRERNSILSAAGRAGELWTTGRTFPLPWPCTAGERRNGFQRHPVPMDSRGFGPCFERLRRGVRDAGRRRPGRWPRLFCQPRDE